MDFNEDFYIAKETLDIDTDLILDRLFKLKHMWVSRSTEFPFYTLGRSAYLDGKTEKYKKDIIIDNFILDLNFNDLYKSVINYLSYFLREPVVMAYDLARPGFHIFPSDKKLLTIAGNWHTDYPHETLGLGDEDTSTFTVPIKIPESGASIDWIDEFDIIYRLPYKEKELIWHSGKKVHRISSLNEYKPDEYRITLQGHLVRRNGQMEVFW